MTPATVCCAFIGCKVFALDAAMPFDFETKASARLRAQTSLRIGIVGFGTFGQFLAKRLVQQGHKVSLCLCSHTHNTLMHIATHLWAIHVYTHASKQCPWLHSITADLPTKKVQHAIYPFTIPLITSPAALPVFFLASISLYLQCNVSPET